jgi:hypothetical protein
MFTGYDNRTPMGVGNIQLVSGVLTNYYRGPAFSSVYGWQMRIQVIPEPASSLGFAAGALGLLWIGARRSRRTSKPRT